MRRSRVFRYAAALAAAMALVAASGCGDGGKASKTTFTYWRASEISLEDIPFSRELEKRNNVIIEYIYPQPGNVQEQLNILYYSDNLPDMIETDWESINFGAESAINNGYILRLDDLIEKYSPNLKEYLLNHPDDANKIRTSQGYFAYPFIRSDESLKVYYGPCIRGEWLDKLGLEMPETLDEWHNVLSRFKNEFGCEAPLAMSIYSDYLMYAFRISDGFYIEDGVVKYGFTEPAYRDYLEMMNTWYEEGLLGENFPNTVYTNNTIEMFKNNYCGIAFDTAGKGIGAALKAGMDVRGLKYPVLNKGEKPFSSNYSDTNTTIGAVSISGNCKDPAAAAKFLDFGYSEEGMLFYNFGVLGESYIMTEEGPIYTELITQSDDTNNAMNRYIRANGSGPFIQMKAYMDQYASAPQQKEALSNWGYSDAKVHCIPNLLFTEQEHIELSNLTYFNYVFETKLDFILGIKDLSEFDEYIETAYEKGVGKALEIYNNAYNEYLTKQR